MKSKFYALLCGLSLVLTCSMHGAEKTVKPKTALAASQAMTASTCTTTAAAAAVTSAESTLSPQQQRRYALTNAATKMFDARKKLQSLLSTDSEEGKALAEWIEGEQEYYSLIKTPVVDPMDATKKVLMEMGKRRLALDNSISHVHSSNDNQRTIKEEYLNLSAQLRTKRAMLFKQCNNTAEAAMKIELDSWERQYKQLEALRDSFLQAERSADSSAAIAAGEQKSAEVSTMIATAAAAAPAASNGAPALSMDDARAHLRNIHSKLDSTREQLRPLLLPGSEAAKALDAWDAVAHQSASAAPLSQTGMNAVAQPAPATATAASAPQQNPLVVPAAAMPAPAKISVITPGKVILTVGTVVGGYAAWRNRDELLKRAKPLAQKMATAVQQQCVIS